MQRGATLCTVALAAVLVGGACAPDVDLSGLLAALEAPGSPPEARDGAEAIRSYQNEREGLCRAISALSDEARHLRTALTAAEAALDLTRQEADTLRDAYRRSLTRRTEQGRGPLGWAFGAGACAGLDGELELCGAAVFGWRL